MSLNPTVLIGVGVVLALFFVFMSKGSKKVAPAALHPQQYKRFKLVKRTDINHNTIIFRFELDSPQHRLGLPVGKHMYLRFLNAEGKPVSRAYTPISSDDQLGYFDLLIKLYPNGQMSEHLKKIKIGEYIEARGPVGKLAYHGNGLFLINRKNAQSNQHEETEVQTKKVGMIAGGSGITPMYQLIKDVTSHPKDKTELSLIFGNQTEEDILLRKEFDELAQSHPNFKVYYTLDRPADSWKQGRGFVTAQMIQERLPAPSKDTLILLCGPDRMIESMIKNLHQLDYSEDMYFVY